MKARKVWFMCGFLVLLTLIYYRHKFYVPVRPAGVPADAFPCRFGFLLRWISIGPPQTRAIVDGAHMLTYDGFGKVIDSEQVFLATPPRYWETTQRRGCEAYPILELRDFEIPPGKIASGCGAVIWVDREKVLVPEWWFK